MLRLMVVARAWVTAGAICVVAVTACVGDRAPLNYKTVQWDSYEAASESPRITVAFYSSGAASGNPCYEPRRLTALEDASTVTIRLEMSGEQGPFSAAEGCTDMAVRDTATVTLHEPLGSRRVLDAARPTATPSRG
jgi:hypothetical protein